MRLALVSPASGADPEKVRRGIAAADAMGYSIEPMPHALDRSHPVFAAAARERLDDLHRAFADPGVDAVICSRGGYGSNYLLGAIDLNLLRTHRRPFIGYSDQTAIGAWMMDQAGVPWLHGAMVAADLSRPDGVDAASFSAALRGQPYALGMEAGLEVLRPGRARGRLHGGCLSLLTSLLGTPFAAHTEGCLLFLEDLGEKPYQVDRMLRHLRLAGKLEGVTGLVFGEMLDCISPGAPPDLVRRVILEALDWFPGPIAYGLRSGHVSRANVTLAMGVRAELVAEAGVAELRIGPREPNPAGN